MTYELVSIDGYKLPDGTVATMDEMVTVADKPRYLQEVALLKQAIGANYESAGEGGAVIGPRTRRRAMEVSDRLETLDQLEQVAIEEPLPVEDTLGGRDLHSHGPFVDVPLDPLDSQPETLVDLETGDKLIDATCGHAWREKDWTSSKCPMCALTGLVMSIRSRLVSPACDPMTRETLKSMISDLDDVP